MDPEIVRLSKRNKWEMQETFCKQVILYNFWVLKTVVPTDFEKNTPKWLILKKMA